ncbi:hypothetical protein [Streptomyces sp. VRA16 Mangrove soil]|uniref:hypothetical protein n=1 Tax=Streptomyces sp. VRA16 Mangrove soil TaxID=2817434 RepID=UPI001A9F41A1|nr:hypothetical protein [Streptomyces sp. VRA16 Mangrove soil]MBO1333788.1 hypothetical protein [Streptomyces sp. VRA16 Mangrove soil]
MTSYSAMHKLLTQLKLPAKYSACAWCGLTASDWAYQWDDPHALDSDHGPYSQNTTSYAPMCRRCHNAFDDAHRSYSAERFPYEVARLKEAAYASVSDERRAAETRGREASRKAALRHLEAREALMPERRKFLSEPQKTALALMSRGYRHNALERAEAGAI